MPQLVYDTNVGKRSAFLNLKSAEGKKRMRELIFEADVVVSK